MSVLALHEFSSHGASDAESIHIVKKSEHLFPERSKITRHCVSSHFTFSLEMIAQCVEYCQTYVNQPTSKT